MTAHGISRYRAGCRCDVCRAANAGRSRRNRQRRAQQRHRLSHGTRSAYDAGCRCSPCGDARVLTYMEREGGYRRHTWREHVTEIYRSARHAWEAEFERRTGREYRAGIIARERCRERRGGRREVCDFIEQHPPPTFRDTLIALRGAAA